MGSELQLRILLLGAWLLIVGLSFRKLRLGLASQKWPTRKGTVVTASIESKPLQYGLRAHAPAVTYEYEVADRRFVGKTFTYVGTVGWTRAFAERRLSTLFPGAVVPVFVNPQDPEQAVLVPGVHWVQWASLCIVSVFFLAIAFIVQILNYIWPGCKPNCT